MRKQTALNQMIELYQKTDVTKFKIALIQSIGEIGTMRSYSFLIAEYESENNNPDTKIACLRALGETQSQLNKHPEI